MPDVVTIGETMLRLSAPPGVPLEAASHLFVHVAGAESNVAVAMSRLGTSAGWISRLTDNSLGRRIYSDIRSHGVDVSRVLWTRADRIGTYFLELGRVPRPGRVIYDRAGSAMAMISPDEVDWVYVREAKVVHLSGITPGLSPSCRTLVARAIDEARAARIFVSFDVNYRALLWTPAEAAAALGALLPKVSILICTAADARLLFGVEGDAGTVAGALRARFRPEVAVVTDGVHFAAAAGARLFQRDGYQVETVDRIGAGDAFAAGFLHGYLTDGVERGLADGAALAALKHTYYGDTVWASAEDVQRLISGDEVWR